MKNFFVFMVLGLATFSFSGCTVVPLDPYNDRVIINTTQEVHYGNTTISQSSASKRGVNDCVQPKKVINCQCTNYSCSNCNGYRY